jgi:outer membrane protein assembly factor BamB
MQPLFIGTNRWVAAVNPRNGEELWRTKLPRGTGAPVTLLVKEPYVFAGCYGHVYCLDARTGDLVWENGLPRMGYYTVLMAMAGADAVSSPAAATEAERQRRQRQATGATPAAGAT